MNKKIFQKNDFLKIDISKHETKKLSKNYTRSKLTKTEKFRTGFSQYWNKIGTENVCI